MSSVPTCQGTATSSSKTMLACDSRKRSFCCSVWISVSRKRPGGPGISGSPRSPWPSRVVLDLTAAEGETWLQKTRLVLGTQASRRCDQHCQESLHLSVPRKENKRHLQLLSLSVPAVFRSSASRSLASRPPNDTQFQGGAWYKQRHC